MARIVMNGGDKQAALKALQIITRMLGRRGVKASSFKAQIEHYRDSWFDATGFWDASKASRISISLSLQMQVPAPRAKR